MTKADLVEHVTASIARTAGPMISKKDCARVVDAFPHFGEFLASLPQPVSRKPSP